MPRPSRFAALSALLLAASLGASGCGTTTFEVEGRQTPVHVWLTAPAIAQQGGTIEALIKVGPYTVVDGPVKFPEGIATVILPPVYIRTGNWQVSADLGNGRYTATSTIGVQREGWVDISLRNRRLTIVHMETEPSRIGRGCP